MHTAFAFPSFPALSVRQSSPAHVLKPLEPLFARSRAKGTDFLKLAVDVLDVLSIKQLGQADVRRDSGSGSAENTRWHSVLVLREEHVGQGGKKSCGGNGKEQGVFLESKSEAERKEDGDQTTNRLRALL